MKRKIFLILVLAILLAATAITLLRATGLPERQESPISRSQSTAAPEGRKDSPTAQYSTQRPADQPQSAPHGWADQLPAAIAAVRQWNPAESAPDFRGLDDIWETPFDQIITLQSNLTGDTYKVRDRDHQVIEWDPSPPHRVVCDAGNAGLEHTEHQLMARLYPEVPPDQMVLAMLTTYKKSSEVWRYWWRTTKTGTLLAMDRCIFDWKGSPPALVRVLREFVPVLAATEPTLTYPQALTAAEECAATWGATGSVASPSTHSPSIDVSWPPSTRT